MNRPACAASRSLTDDELLLLTLLAAGCAGTDLARRLGCSVATARRRTFSVREALGAQSNIHAVVLAIQRGLI